MARGLHSAPCAQNITWISGRPGIITNSAQTRQRTRAGRRTPAPRANNWTIFGIATAQLIAATTVVAAAVVFILRHRPGERLESPANRTPKDRLQPEAEGGRPGTAAQVGAQLQFGERDVTRSDVPQERDEERPDSEEADGKPRG